jgi:hypothetical protein
MEIEETYNSLRKYTGCLILHPSLRRCATSENAILLRREEMQNARLRLRKRLKNSHRRKQEWRGGGDTHIRNSARKQLKELGGVVLSKEACLLD